MEESSNPNFIGHNHIDIDIQRPWSTYDPQLFARSQFLIKFTFSCFSHYTEWVESEEYPPSPRLLSHDSRPEANKSVVINHRQFLDYQECRQSMLLELRDLPLTHPQREKLMLSARTEAQKGLDSMSFNHNVLNLHLRIDVVHRHVIRREDPDLRTSRVMQEPFDVAAATMPAAETAVEMVMREKVELDEMQTCTICLEEVREAVRLPCSHVFHGGCIKEWLRNNHRCPLCRFEMPVAMEI